MWSGIFNRIVQKPAHKQSHHNEMKPTIKVPKRNIPKQKISRSQEWKLCDRRPHSERISYYKVGDVWWNINRSPNWFPPQPPPNRDPYDGYGGEWIHFKLTTIYDPLPKSVAVFSSALHWTSRIMCILYQQCSLQVLSNSICQNANMPKPLSSPKKGGHQ